jgi:phosphoribosylanthranilate isomerase
LFTPDNRMKHFVGLIAALCYIFGGGRSAVVRVKICGITSSEEARIAISCGADAVGFLVGLNYPTEDEIDKLAAKEIIASLPPFVSTVLVTHSKELAWVVDTCQLLGCTTIQLHGDFAREKIPLLRAKVPYARIIKAVHVVDSNSVTVAAGFAQLVDAVLLDTKTQTRIGGTGITHDWSISAKIAKKISAPVILAGGLTPGNVSAAILKVKPFAVDVNSGVENTDGRKSLEKIKAFIRSAKESNDRASLTARFPSAPLI